ncbi:TonB-dependent receptor [Massilia sp. Dwa41.01b]|uniref:TonB-dependent receptor n=1 Tax=unclassified Massilia TaxID=2609279 RepID=UPI001602CCDD|nr:MULTISPECIES: TonB-dependent receptor [unclassified Massilia]QNA89055.1 TonB-dependent receptor [Massilia sp. Dwa41.01b]QNA99943.1 TonB-dependent receptor [Massilia sp. Se16.2.3]
METSAPQRGRHANAQIQFAILTLLAGIGSAQAQNADTQAAAQSPAAGNAQPAVASSDSKVIPEVRVTATKRSTPLQKTPIAITALSAANLADNHVQTMLDVVALVPGFQATAQGDHGVTTMTLRGIGNDSAKTQYADPEVASFVDNVYSPRAEGATALMFDVAGIEVLRGPQGTLWGRNSTVGAVNIQTVKPELNSRSGYVEGGIGDYHRFGARGAVNVPLSDTAALRFAIVHEQHDGYVDYQNFPGVPIESQRAAFVAAGGDPAAFRPINGNNYVIGGDKYNAQNQTAARVSLLWNITPSVHWNVAYENFADRGTPSANLMQQPRPGQDHWSMLSDSAPWIKRDSHNIRSRLSYDLSPDLALHYIAGVSAYRGSMRFDQDGGSVLPTSIRSGGVWQEHTTTDSHYRSHSHELELQSLGARTVDWQAGLYYAAEKNDIRFDIPIMNGTEDGTVVWQGSFIQPKETVASRAAFGQATWNVSDALHLTGGLRYTHDRRENVGGRAYTWAYDATAPQLPLNPSMDPRLPGQGFKEDVPGNDGVFKGSKVTGLVRVNYDLDRNNMVYASVATGYKSGGTQDRGLTYQPETLTNYEIGSKSTFMGGAVRVNNALFYSNFKDFQFNSPVNFSDGSRGLAIENAEGAKVYGLESEIAARLSPSDRLSITLAFLKAELGRLVAGSNDYALPPCTVDTRIATCLDVSGNKMPHAPRFSTTIQYQHTFRLADGANLVPRITAHYETDAELSVFNLGPEDRQEAYATGDIGLRYQNGKGWWIDAWVRNVNDKKIKTSAFNGFGPWLAQYKPPRTIGLNTGFDF